MIQNVVWSVSIVLMGCLALVFIWVAAGARFAIINYGPAIDDAYRIRVWLFGLALVVLIGTNYQTLRELPYINALPQLGGAAVRPA